MIKVNTVTVVGANGTMGCNISGIFASFGAAKVYMVSRDIKKAQKAADRAAKSVKAGSIRDRLIPADYSMLSKCVRQSDLVFESVAERLETKLEINRKIAEYARNDTICCTGSSGLSIHTLAEAFPPELRKNYMGMHMYNPPYSMTLCELVPTKYTDPALYQEVERYASETLLRSVVRVKDCPAFLGNRIGFQFINQALIYAERYQDNGGIDYIDSILGPFTGRNMAPLTTSDFVGLDVHRAIVDNIYQNTSDYAHETFCMPDFAVKLVEEGKLGRKTGEGLYKTEYLDNGYKQVLTYDISSASFRRKYQYSFPFIEKMVAAIAIGDYQAAFEVLVRNDSNEARICLEFLIDYIVYSLYTAQEVGYDIHAADDVMANGFNWCPPMALLEALLSVAPFEELVGRKLPREALSSVDLHTLLAKADQSRYDYRRYIKAKR